MSSTRARRPMRRLSGSRYRAAPVTTRIRNRLALTQCTARSTRSKRTRRDPERVARSGGRVVAAIAVTNPSFDVVVSFGLPVARLHPVDHLDPRHPLERLVAVHGRDVEPHGAAVLP